MTTVEDAHALVEAPKRSILDRPRSTTGVWSWFTTVDHKKIAILYAATALFFFLVGGSEALLIRLQLARPDGTILTANQYNQLFTMHGTTMIFLLGMPLASAFGNYLIPLMIGARDVAFPRLNMLGYWIFLFGGIFLYSSFLLGGAPNGGWFGYAPLTSTPMAQGFLPGRGPDFWAVGIIMLGIGSVATEPMPRRISPTAQKSAPLPGRKPCDIGVLVSGAYPNQPPSGAPPKMNDE